LHLALGGTPAGKTTIMGLCPSLYSCFSESEVRILALDGIRRASNDDTFPERLHCKVSYFTEN